MWVKTYCSVEKIDLNRVTKVIIDGTKLEVWMDAYEDNAIKLWFNTRQEAECAYDGIYYALVAADAADTVDESTEDQRQTGGSLSPVPWVEEVVKRSEDLGRIWHTGGYPQRINYCEARMVPA